MKQEGIYNLSVNSKIKKTPNTLMILGLTAISEDLAAP
jgi:hypothetical protein